MEAHELREIQQQVGFDASDLDALRAFYAYLSPYVDEVVEEFSATLLREPKAREQLSRGDQRFLRIREGFRGWLESLFTSERSEDYLRARTRIGAAHGELAVELGLVLGALSRVRTRLICLGARAPLSPVARERTLSAVSRALDLDTALMLAGQRDRVSVLLQSQERLSSVGLVSAGLAHELRNPLATLETSLFLAKNASSPAELERHLRRMQEQLATCGELVGGIVELSRGRPPPRRTLDLPELVEEVASSLERPPGIELHVDVPDGLRTFADRVLLRQVLANLLRNSLQALGATGQVRVEARAANGGTSIRVVDDGPGISQEDRARLFEGVFSTKPDGVGVGLLLCRRILESHGGSLVIEDSARGASFRLWLPAEPSSPG